MLTRTLPDLRPWWDAHVPPVTAAVASPRPRPGDVVWCTVWYIPDPFRGVLLREGHGVWPLVVLRPDGRLFAASRTEVRVQRALPPAGRASCDFCGHADCPGCCDVCEDPACLFNRARFGGSDGPVPEDRPEAERPCAGCGEEDCPGCDNYPGDAEDPPAVGLTTPTVCQYFALCTNLATTTVDGGPLGPIPACQRCADKVARLARRDPTAVRAVVDYDARVDTLGGLLGRWTVTYIDAQGAAIGGLIAGLSQVVEDAKREGLSLSQLDYTAAARAEAWRQFRARYGRR